MLHITLSAQSTFNSHESKNKTRDVIIKIKSFEETIHSSEIIYFGISRTFYMIQHAIAKLAPNNSRTTFEHHPFSESGCPRFQFCQMKLIFKFASQRGFLRPDILFGHAGLLLFILGINRA